MSSFYEIFNGYFTKMLSKGLDQYTCPPGSGEHCFSVFSLWSPWHLLISSQQENSTVFSWKQIVTLSCQYLSPPDHGSVCICVRIYVWRIAISALRGLITLSPEAIVTVAGSGYHWQWLPLIHASVFLMESWLTGISQSSIKDTTVFLITWTLKLTTPC